MAAPLLFPDDIVGDRVSRLVDVVTRRRGRDTEVNDDADGLVALAPAVLQSLRRSLGGATPVRLLHATGTELHLLLEQTPTRRWRLRCRIEDEDPHRVIAAEVDRALPDGVEVRLARPEDNDAILEVCRGTPITLDDAELTIDPGADYFAALALMGQAASMVATYDDKIVGVQCGTAYPVRFGGRHQLMSQILHTRVLPDYSGMGLWAVLQQAMTSGEWMAGEPIRADGPRSHRQQEAARRVDESRRAATEPENHPGDTKPTRLPLNSCGYFSVDNDTMRRLSGSTPTWTCQPYRIVLRCEPTSELGTEPGRAATEADAAEIVEIINSCHDREELFLPYTEDFLAARLSRAPDAYSWSDLRLTEHAVLGVWTACQRRSLTRDGETEVSVRGLVLDYGFHPAHVDEFIALLRAACAAAAEHGLTHLSIFSSTASPGSTELRALAERIEAYELVTPFTAEPPDTVDRGVYVDQIYF